MIESVAGIIIAPPSPWRARGDQQDPEHQKIGVHHPLDLGEPGVEVLHDAGDGDVDDRAVQQEHEQPDTEDG